MSDVYVLSPNDYNVNDGCGSWGYWFYGIPKQLLNAFGTPRLEKHGISYYCIRNPNTQTTITIFPHTRDRKKARSLETDGFWSQETETGICTMHSGASLSFDQIHQIITGTIQYYQNNKQTEIKTEKCAEPCQEKNCFWCSRDDIEIDYELEKEFEEDDYEQPRCPECGTDEEPVRGYGRDFWPEARYDAAETYYSLCPRCKYVYGYTY